MSKHYFDVGRATWLQAQRYVVAEMRLPIDSYVYLVQVHHRIHVHEPVLCGGVIYQYWSILVRIRNWYLEI